MIKKSKKILYNFACRSRKEKMFEAIENILSLSKYDNFLIQLTLDVDDSVLIDKYVVDRINSYGDKVKAHYGISKSKVDAINRDVRLCTDWDILVNMSDDMRFLVKGFDLTIIKAFEDYFPNGDGFIHFNDGNQKVLSTMSILDRKHYDRFLYVYHPSYMSLFCDNEAQDVAKLLGCYKYMGDSVNIIKHQHPLHDSNFKMDKQYQKTESFYHVDGRNYRNRKKINFGL